MKLFVFLSLLFSQAAADGEEFIRRFEEIIEHGNDTLEQKQKLVELETVFAYGEKFSFQDKMVDLTQYYTGRDKVKKEEIRLQEKILSEIIFTDEILSNNEKAKAEEKPENQDILMVNHVITYIETMKYTIKQKTQHESEIEGNILLILLATMILIGTLGVLLFIYYCHMVKNRHLQTGETKQNVSRKNDPPDCSFVDQIKVDIINDNNMLSSLKESPKLSQSLFSTRPRLATPTETPLPIVTITKDALDSFRCNVEGFLDDFEKEISFSEVLVWNDSIREVEMNIKAHDLTIHK